MTDIEKRRVKLLQETRKNDGAGSFTPAIHPRFQATYNSLYHPETEVSYSHSNSLIVRSMIAALLFAIVFLLDAKGETIGTVDSKRIICEISYHLLSK